MEELPTDVLYTIALNSDNAKVLMTLASNHDVRVMLQSSLSRVLENLSNGDNIYLGETSNSSDLLDIISSKYLVRRSFDRHRDGALKASIKLE